jgi:NAD(P)-dependent dehydrogenase (short-subunit alcohol dehydrogenase family)
LVMSGGGRSAKQRKSSCDGMNVLAILIPACSVPMAKPPSPEDVAMAIVFLASERFSGSVHGQLLPVDAGKMGAVAWTKDELAQRK